MLSFLFRVKILKQQVEGTLGNKCPLKWFMDL